MRAVTEAKESLTKTKAKIDADLKEQKQAIEETRTSAYDQAQQLVTKADQEVQRLKDLLAQAQKGAKQARKDARSQRREADQVASTATADAISQANQARQEARGEFKTLVRDAAAKVSDANAQAWDAFLEELGDRAAYDADYVLDHALSLVGGAKSVISTIRKAFDEGYKADTGYKPSARLEKRRQPETTGGEAANDTAPPVAGGPN